MALLYLHALLLLFAGICLAEVISLRTQVDNRITDLSTRVHIRKTQDTFENGVNEPLDLLDIVLVASVDGSLHALNRTSGDALWSIASSTSGDTPSTLGALVRTRHPDPDPDAEGDEGQEVYVIEPQSGEIYVMASPDSPLQRLPLSMPQLVEMSPYSMSGEDSMKVFVGKKETSLLLVELETGRIRATINPNSECPWDPFDDFSRQGDEDDLDLDELEGSTPPRANHTPTEVFIGRTDYHISIHTRPLNAHSPRPPVQNLSFSTYGPNNQDHALQTIYRRTADETYIQSLPNGKIMSFKSKYNSEDDDLTSHAHVVWGQSFAHPVVAVFDVVKTPSRHQPFVLLQPRISLQDLLPNVDVALAAKAERFPNLESAYVGIVEETGSLFAMSPDHFPLVVFGDANFDDYDYNRGIGPPPVYDPDRDFPSDMESITRAVKRKKLRELCRTGSSDRRCLTGVRRLESSRLSRLLDGAATVPNSPFHYSNMQAPASEPQSEASPGNASVGAPPSVRVPRIESALQSGLRSTTQAFSAYAVGVLVLIFTIGWLFFKRDLKSGSASKSTPLAATTAGPTQPRDVSPEDIPIAAAMSDLSAPLSDSLLPESQSSTLVEPEPTLSKEVESALAAEEKPIKPPAASRKVKFGDTIKVTGVDPDGKDEAVADGEGDESEGDAPATPGKRKALRRRRGKKKKGSVSNGAIEDPHEVDKEAKLAEESGSDVPQINGKIDVIHVVSPSSLVVPPPPTPAVIEPSLIVSDTILGFGSHGTVVYKGALQGRAVAVKRLLQDFVTLAAREVNILQESDDHPNVIRYYYQEARAGFLYIALELCPASLADIIERPDQFREISIAFEPKKALRQITSGLRHLHALKIVHRDIKPHNILISAAKPGVGEAAGHRMLISDFGLCKKLEVDQTSFVPTVHGAMAAGTVGWRAPEILRGEVKLDEPGSEESQSSRGSIGLPADSGMPTGKPTRLTKSVDIFALGCLFYYVLTNGGHPFGDRYEREVNILKNAKCLDGLERFGEEGADAVDLITKMLSPDAHDRPDTTTCLLHPYFWDPGKRLNFLQDASDRFEIMCRDPRDFMLIQLETGAFAVVGNDWNARLDKWFIENLGKYRKYDGKSVQDLLRALRNKKHHYQDLPDNVKRQIGSMPEGFLAYFTKRFPNLFLHVHTVISSSSLHHESMFRTYFELTD